MYVEKLTTDPSEPETVDFAYVMKNARILKAEKERDAGGITITTYNFAYLQGTVGALTLVYFNNLGQAIRLSFSSPTITLDTVEEI